MLQLSESTRERLAEEYKFAAQKIQETPELATKLFFFSAFFGEANRAMNASWSSDLALLHLVIQSAHASINQRLLIPSPGLGLPEDFTNSLTKVSSELADLFQKKKIERIALYEVLAKITELAYTTTGNGYYLYTRGAIKI